MNCQVLYRIDMADDETIIKLHEIAQGDDTVIEKRVLSTLTTIAQSAASKINSTDAIRQYDKFYMDIRKQFVNNEELKKQGILLEDFVLAGEPDFDSKTKELFLAQQTADLMKQTAEAEKLKFISEKEKTIAQYEKEQAENEGKAKALMAKEVKDAEREASVAKINAERDKTVAETEAAKKLAVAELQRKTEEENLKIKELVAKQMEVEALAKEVAIQKSGAITEKERVNLEFEMKTKIGVAAEMAKTYAHWNPQVIQVSGGNGNVSSVTSSLDNFLNMETAKTAIEITKKSK